MFRLFSVAEISIVMPMRWFAGNSHKLMNYGWSMQSNGRLLDTLHESMLQLKEEPANIINNQFTMNIFLLMN